MRNTPLLLKSLCLAALVICLSLAGYWIKCQLAINIIPGITWEKYLPFLRAFQRSERVPRTAPGAVFTATFDELLPRYNWGGIWARDAGTVQYDIVPEGLHGSKALHIHNTSLRDWTLNSRIMLEVKPGDEFVISGYARTSADATSHMSVIFYDALDKVTKWDGAQLTIKDAGWQLYANRIVVSEGTARVRFRFDGIGIGDSYFDDILFFRIK